MSADRDTRRTTAQAAKDACPGEWHWVDPLTDVPLDLPSCEEYADTGYAVDLRTVDEWIGSVGLLPRWILHCAEEVDTACAAHIAASDPAQVLADLDAHDANESLIRKMAAVIANHETDHEATVADSVWDEMADAGHMLTVAESQALRRALEGP